MIVAPIRERCGTGISTEWDNFKARASAASKAAAERGWIDGDAVAIEHLTAVKRAGADVILTYFARELAERGARAEEGDGNKCRSK